MHKSDYRIPDDSLDKTDGDQHSRIDETVPYLRQPNQRPKTGDYESSAFLASKFRDHGKTPFPRQSFDSTAANQRSLKILFNRSCLLAGSYTADRMQIKSTQMQTQCLLNRSDKAFVDKARLIRGNGDSGVRNTEKPSLNPSTRLIPSRKRIALVAHDNQKAKMASWALKHRTRLIEHELYATAHTPDIIAEVLKSVPLLDCP